MSHRTAIAAICYVLVGFILRATYGTYHATLVWALAGLVATIAYLALSRSGARGATLSADSSPEFVLASTIAALAGILAIDPLLITARPGVPLLVVRVAAIAVSFSSAVIAFGHTARRVEVDHKLSRRTMFACVAVAWYAVFVLRVAAVVATPLPRIDVYVTNTMACDYLLAGSNPYAGWYPDIYEGAKDYAPGYFYWPAYLLFATPFRWAFGDIRFAVVAADLITALLLVVIVRKSGLSQRVAWLAPLVWLAFPAGLLVLELAWIDPVLVMGVAALAAALVSRRWLLVGVAMGVVAATKQYGALAGVMALAYLWSANRAALPRVIASAAATFAAIMAPFVWLDGKAFYEQTIATYLTTSMRLDSLSLVVWMQRELGFAPSGGVLLAVYLMIVGVCGWRLARGPQTQLHRWAGATAVSYGAIFLLGRLAFCNYYHFVAFWILLYMLLSLAEDRVRIASPVTVVERRKSATAKGVVTWST